MDVARAKWRVQVSVSSGEQPSSEHPVEIGPPPYYRQSDCNICRKQDGLKTGSGLLDVPHPGGYIVEGEHFLALMERAPHFHLWFVPKRNEGELLGVAYLAQQPPLSTSFSEAEAVSRKIRERFEQS
jgi:hypothetical protein